MIEVIEDTKSDENIRMKVPGKRRAKDFFVEDINMPPESKSTVNDIQRRFRRDSKQCEIDVWDDRYL